MCCTRAKVIFLAVLIFNFHLSIFKVPMKKYIFLSILLAIAANTTAQSKDNTVIISGHVVDSAHHDIIPFVHVAAVQNDSVIAKTMTDFDGFFKLGVPVGEYVLQFFGVGLLRREIPIIANKDIELDTMVMISPDPFYWDEHIIFQYPPAIEIDPYGANQKMEVEGVKVIVR